jgi:hypothetical protein
MPYAEGDKRSSRHYQCTYRNGTTKTSKDAFNEEVDFLGINIDFKWSFCQRIVKYSERILELMADGALNTVFTKKNLIK